MVFRSFEFECFELKTKQKVGIESSIILAKF